MIKNVKLFVNDNNKSIQNSVIIKDKLMKSGFIITNDEHYDLALAVGGDGSFLRMVKQNNYNDNIYYVGVNSGHLGFLQEVTMDDLDKFIYELKNNKYKVEDIGIQNTIVNTNNHKYKLLSLNEIIIRDEKYKTLDVNIMINNDLLEVFKGDGIMIATTLGSTAHNISYGGSIVYSTLPTLQITPMAPINSKLYRSLFNSVIVPDNNIIKITPASSNNNYDIVVDGVDNVIEDVCSVETKVSDKKIKCLRFSHYNFPQKVNDKLLSN